MSVIYLSIAGCYQIMNLPLSFQMLNSIGIIIDIIEHINSHAVFLLDNTHGTTLKRESVSHYV